MYARAVTSVVVLCGDVLLMALHSSQVQRKVAFQGLLITCSAPADPADLNRAFQAPLLPDLNAFRGFL